MVAYDASIYQDSLLHKAARIDANALVFLVHHLRLQAAIMRQLDFFGACLCQDFCGLFFCFCLTASLPLFTLGK